MIFTDNGILISFNDEQPQKLDSPIFVAEKGNNTFDKYLQSLKQNFSINLIDCGITIVFIFWFPSKSD